MTVKGRKISYGWLSVFVLLLVIGIVGVVDTSGAGSFNMPNNHLFANVAWMITATIFVLMMTPGLSFFYGGMVRVKNVISTMLQSFIVMGFVSVIWVVFGFGLAFGNDIGHVIGNPCDFFMFNVSSMKIIKRESADYHTRVLSLSSVSLETGNKPLSHQ